jgi:hypothetical protein
MSADSENDGGTGGKRLKLKWLENENHERARRSNKQERRVASKLGGRRIRNSGGARWSKHDGSTDGGDVATPEFHVEQKTTKKASMSLKREWLGKVREGARKFGKDPAVVITFDDPNKPYDPPEDWILVPIDVARRVLGYQDED